MIRKLANPNLSGKEKLERFLNSYSKFIIYFIVYKIKVKKKKICYHN